MLKRPAVNYCYDGSIEGFYCCVFYSFLHREIPADIFSSSNNQKSLYQTVEIKYNEEHSRRVYNGIIEKLTRSTLNLVLQCFLSDLPSKELHLLEFLHHSFKNGKDSLTHLSLDCVLTVQKAAQRCRMEAHKYKGFVRFTQRGGILVSEIHPCCRVLPLITHHFKQRFITENIMIIDRTHNDAMIASAGRAGIIAFDKIDLEKADESEGELSELWRCFFKTVSIRQRYNPSCQRSHLPIRYRSDMTEFSDVIR